MDIADVVYAACALTSLACAVLLLRGYGATRVRLLLWSGLCFGGLALNNTVLLLDRSVMPSVDLSAVRTLPAVAGIALLLYGLIWDGR